MTKGRPHKKTSLDQKGRPKGHQPGHPEAILQVLEWTTWFFTYKEATNKEDKHKLRFINYRPANTSA